MSEPYFATDRPIVVWDLDSTLADTRGRRHLCPTVDPAKTWRDYALGCDTDVPIAGSVALAAMFYDAGYAQHIVSGRVSAAHEQTMTWLHRHNVPYDLLRLKTAADPDEVVDFKVGYVQMLIRRGATPRLVVEDWPAIAEAVEALGVPVLCVNPRYGSVPAGHGS